jgi:NAD-dependent dihydropyrimidine dehydrogenase PreA subunit
MVWVIVSAGFAGIMLLFWFWAERWHLILPGTWPALKWLGFRNTLTLGWHGILYGRWTVPYIKAASGLVRFFSRWNWGRWLLNREIAQRYHAKVLTPELAGAIIKIDRDIPLQHLEDRIIPYARARDIILNADDEYALYQCGCKTARHDPCCAVPEKPYMTCILIGKILVDFLVEHNPETSRRISRMEALGLLEKFHSWGLVHNAWFKDALKDQFYVICNCCTCCCLGFESMRLGVKQVTSSGYVAVVNEDACKGCESIVDCCPFGAIFMKDGKSHVDWEKCMGCGVCESKCPNHARMMVLDERKGVPMDVRSLGSVPAAHA